MWVAVAAAVIALFIFASIGFLVSLRRNDDAMLSTYSVGSKWDASPGKILKSMKELSDKIDERGESPRIVGIVVNPKKGQTVDEMFEEHGIEVVEKQSVFAFQIFDGIPVFVSDKIEEGRIFPIFGSPKLGAYEPLDISFKAPEFGSFRLPGGGMFPWTT